MNNDRNVSGLVKRFDEMLDKNELYFFDVEEFELIAEHFFFSGQTEKAVKAIEVGQDQHPLSPAFPLKRAQYLVTLDKLEEAADELDIAEGLDPYNIELMIARASILSKKGKHNLALKMLKDSLNSTDDPYDIYNLITAEYQHLGNYTQAIVYLKLMLEQVPDDDVAMYNIAMCYDALDKPHSSIEYFNQFIERNPYNELAWYHLGITYGKVKMMEKAIESLEYALLVDEHFCAAYYEIARLYEKQDNYESAANTYLRSIEFDEPTGYIYYKLGHCYLQMHNNKKAMRFLQRAIKEDDQLDEAYLEMSAIQIVEGRKQEALHNLQMALELDPENPNYLFTAIEIYDKAEMPLEMANIYKKLKSLGHNDADFFMDYAETLIDLDEIEDAIELLREGIEVNQDNDEIHLVLAGYLLADGDYSNAIDHLLRANSIDATSFEKFSEFFPELAEEKSINGLIKQLTSAM